MAYRDDCFLHSVVTDTRLIQTVLETVTMWLRHSSALERYHCHAARVSLLLMSAPIYCYCSISPKYYSCKCLSAETDVWQLGVQKRVCFPDNGRKVLYCGPRGA